jgi:ubiquinol-cytochrome c reductase cytochrome b subunit
VPQKLLGVLVMAGSLITLVFIPWLDTSKVRSNRFRPMMKQFFWIFVIDCAILGYCGSQGADASLEMMHGMQLPLVWVARVCTLYYFGFFWVIMPLVGLFETPKPLPTSISQPVLAAE